MRSLDRSRIELNLHRFWPVLCEGQKRLREATGPSMASAFSGSTALASGLAAWSLGGALILVACKDGEPTEREAPQAAPSPAPLPPPKPPRPWFSGHWVAQVHLEPQPSALAADARDRGEAPPSPALTGGTSGQEGPTTQLALAVSIDDDGTAHGNLGEQEIRGQVDGETLRARVSGGPPSGVLIGQRTSRGWSCTLRLSTGDSAGVFASQFLLTPAAPTTP